MLANFRSPEFRIGFYQDVLMSFTSVTSRNVTGERIKEKPGEDGEKKESEERYNIRSKGAEVRYRYRELYLLSYFLSLLGK